MDSLPPTDSPAFRLRTARKALGKTQEEFGAPMGYGKAAISTWETGRTEIGLTMAQSIQVNWGVNWRWLLFGEGDIWGETAVNVVRQDAARADFLLRPEIDGSATCGPGGQIQEPGPMAPTHALARSLAEKLLHDSGGGREQDLFFLRCEGESMQPTIRDKEIVLINAALQGRMNPRNNAIYLVRRSPNSNDARVKRVRLDQDRHQLVLASDNRSFAPAIIDLDGIPLHQVVLGRVCWVGRHLLDTDPPEGDW